MIVVTTPTGNIDATEQSMHGCRGRRGCSREHRFLVSDHGLAFASSAGYGCPNMQACTAIGGT